MKDLFNHEVIRTLGMYWPFSVMMLHGKIETRWVRNGKKPPFPLGKYLIYTTKKGYNTDELLECEMITLEQYDEIKKALYTEKIIFGIPLCIGDLVEIIDPIMPDTPNTFVSYQAPDVCNRRVGLVFKNVKRVKTFELKGKQGIGFLTEEQKSKLEIIEGLNL